MTPTEALDRIAAHCDELETDAHPGRLIAQVRAVLAEVTPETDRAALARAWDEGYANGAHSTVEEDAANGNLSFDNPYAGRKATQ